MGVLFIYSLIPPYLRRWHNYCSYGLVISAYIIGQGRVDGVGCVDDSVLPPPLFTSCSSSHSSIIFVADEGGDRGVVDTGWIDGMGGGGGHSRSERSPALGGGGRDTP